MNINVGEAESARPKTYQNYFKSYFNICAQIFLCYLTTIMSEIVFLILIS